MKPIQIRFGRVVKSIGECAAPLSIAADAQNVDIDEAGSAARRRGYQRAISSAMTGPVYFLHQWEDYTGETNYILVDDSGVRRE